MRELKVMKKDFLVKFPSRFLVPEKMSPVIPRHTAIHTITTTILLELYTPDLEKSKWVFWVDEVQQKVQSILQWVLSSVRVKTQSRRKILESRKGGGYWFFRRRRDWFFLAKIWRGNRALAPLSPRFRRLCHYIWGSLAILRNLLRWRCVLV